MSDKKQILPVSSSVVFAAYGICADNNVPIKHLKQPSISTESDLKDFERYCPNSTETVIVSEKIDGSNMSISFVAADRKLLGMALAKRTKIINNDKELFPGWFEPIILRKEEIISLVLGISELYPGQKTIRLFCELYGLGVLKRIKYTDKQFDIVVYRILVDGKPLDIQTVVDLCTFHNVPCVSVWQAELHTLLDTSANRPTLVQIPSRLAQQNGIIDLRRSMAEGVVFQFAGSNTVYKLRRDDFQEKAQRDIKTVPIIGHTIPVVPAVPAVPAVHAVPIAQGDIKTNSTIGQPDRKIKLNRDEVMLFHQIYLDKKALCSRSLNMHSKQGDWLAKSNEIKTEDLLNDIMESILHDHMQQIPALFVSAQQNILKNSMKKAVSSFVANDMMTLISDYVTLLPSAE